MAAPAEITIVPFAITVRAILPVLITLQCASEELADSEPWRSHSDHVPCVA